jgi:hypothetical protein
MNIRLNFSALKQTKWHEYLIRFVFGGLVTVAAGLVARKYGPVVGGLFLAFPSIFPASITLVQAHSKEKQQKKGEDEQDSEQKARQDAGTTAQGAAMGSFGLLGFAVILWNLSLNLAPWLVLLLALAVWFVIGFLVWWITRKITGKE